MNYKRVAQIIMMHLLTFGSLVIFYASFPLPFEAARQRDTCRRIRDVELKLPSLAHDLIQRFLQYDPSKRIALADITSHLWIVQQLWLPE